MGDGARGFWGSIEAEGGPIMINLRLVRYARPNGAGTRLVFANNDEVDVLADFAAVSHRLYEAYDPSGGEGGKDEGKDAGGGKDG